MTLRATLTGTSGDGDGDGDGDGGLNVDSVTFPSTPSTVTNALKFAGVISPVLVTWNLGEGRYVSKEIVIDFFIILSCVSPATRLPVSLSEEIKALL